MIALIPARSGSKRIPDKNIRKLNGHPLLCYSIWLALDSDLFDGVYVSSDSPEYCEIAENAGARVIERPTDLAMDESTDWGWINHALLTMDFAESFAVLRPTNPFRTQELLKRAKLKFENYECDSLRCVSIATEHPKKMWHSEGLYIYPAYGSIYENAYTWSTQKLLDMWPVRVQNAALEMYKVESYYKHSGLVGDRCIGIEPHGYEAFDINTELDWITAEALISKKLVELPR